MAAADETTLVYLYGVVRGDAPEPPADLYGIDGGPVRLLREDDVAALVGDVAAADYGEEVLDARLRDLQWVGERGIAHEQVLLWSAERGPVVPMHPFSLHQGEERVRERLRAGRERLAELLRSLEGRQEWGVKVWRSDEAVGQHLDELSPAVRSLTEEIEKAPPGRRFLLSKKREGLRETELRAASARVARRVYEELKSLAEGAVAVPLPPPPDQDRVLALHAAFLVPQSGFSAFHRGVSEAAARYSGVGFEFEFTGPWPAYHFAKLDGN